MMVVYLVMNAIAYEGDYLIAAYSSEQQAKLHVEALNQAYKTDNNSYHVIEEEVKEEYIKEES